MRRTLIGLLTAATLALGATAGCGGGDDETDDAATEAPASTQAGGAATTAAGGGAGAAEPPTGEALAFCDAYMAAIGSGGGQELDPAAVAAELETVEPPSEIAPIWPAFVESVAAGAAPASEESMDAAMQVANYAMTTCAPG